MEKLLSLEESAPHAWAVEKSAAQCNPATTAMRQQMLGSATSRSELQKTIFF